MNLHRILLIFGVLVIGPISAFGMDDKNVLRQSDIREDWYIAMERLSCELNRAKMLIAARSGKGIAVGVDAIEEFELLKSVGYNELEKNIMYPLSHPICSHDKNGPKHQTGVVIYDGVFTKIAEEISKRTVTKEELDRDIEEIRKLISYYTGLLSFLNIKVIPERYKYDDIGYKTVTSWEDISRNRHCFVWVEAENEFVLELGLFGSIGRYIEIDIKRMTAWDWIGLASACVIGMSIFYYLRKKGFLKPLIKETGKNSRDGGKEKITLKETS